ncbi:hypothetical protein NL299_27105, partial [Klebsiella pneumoniae]|nr:hypothetical protein [Klebsiella pneumoniae]
SCKSNDQLLLALSQAKDEDTILGIKKVLISRGFSRKELNEADHWIYKSNHFPRKQSDFYAHFAAHLL